MEIAADYNDINTAASENVDLVQWPDSGTEITQIRENSTKANMSSHFLQYDCMSINCFKSMDNFTNFQAPPQEAYLLWSCDKVYHKQEVCFLLYFLGQIISWQYNPNLLD